MVCIPGPCSYKVDLDGLHDVDLSCCPINTIIALMNCTVVSLGREDAFLYQQRFKSDFWDGINPSYP